LQNVQAALTAANGKVKDNGLETRELQATLETISHTSDEHKVFDILLNISFNKRAEDIQNRACESL
jgi:hypothetical protein